MEKQGREARAGESAAELEERAARFPVNISHNEADGRGIQGSCIPVRESRDLVSDPAEQETRARSGSFPRSGTESTDKRGAVQVPVGTLPRVGTLTSQRSGEAVPLQFDYVFRVAVPTTKMACPRCWWNRSDLPLSGSRAREISA